jgi:hypothetical protein
MRMAATETNMELAAPNHQAGIFYNSKFETGLMDFSLVLLARGQRVVNLHHQRLNYVLKFVELI